MYLNLFEFFTFFFFSFSLFLFLCFFFQKMELMNICLYLGGCIVVVVLSIAFALKRAWNLESHVTTAKTITKPRYRAPICLYNTIRSTFSPPSLSLDDIVNAALKKSNVNEFENKDFMEPLSRLIQSLNTEAKLHPFGVFMTKERLVSCLCQRLAIERVLREFPEIEEETISRPIFVSGMARTGTTLLQRLFGCDSTLRLINCWEGIYPCPENLPLFISNPEKEIQQRISKVEMSSAFMRIFFPAFFAIHPVDPHQPEEEITILDLTLISQCGEALYHIPTFGKWKDERDETIPYLYLKKVLQILQWSDKIQKKPERRFLLKTPEHLDHLPSLFSVFSDAQIVQSHRDILVSIPSFCSMTAHGRAIFSDKVDPVLSTEYWLFKIERMVNRSLSFRLSNPQIKFIDVLYKNLRAEPVPQMKEVYKKLGMNWREEIAQNIEKWIQRNKQHKNGRHLYQLQDFGLSEEELNNRFKKYLQFVSSLSP